MCSSATAAPDGVSREELLAAQAERDAVIDVSTREQNLARQQAGPTAAGCVKCFFDKASGKNTDGTGLHQAYDYLRPGDALIVVSLDRLGRSPEDLIAIVAHLKRMDVGFLSLAEKLDTTTPGGMFVFHVFAALAQFTRNIIVADTNDGLAAARARGQRLDRPPAITPERSPTPSSYWPSPNGRCARLPRCSRFPRLDRWQVEDLPGLDRGHRCPPQRPATFLTAPRPVHEAHAVGRR